MGASVEVRSVVRGAYRKHRLRRQVVDRLTQAGAGLAVAIALLPLVAIVFVLCRHALATLSPTLLTETTNGVAGGLQNAILGTIALVGLALLLAVPVGVGTGVFLAEGDRPWLGASIRYLSDVLTGVPSIVLGYFSFLVFVLDFGWGFSWLAGSLSLALIMLPYIARASDLALRQVPRALKEGSLALGLGTLDTLRYVSLRVALPGILTGILLATGVAVGETAPLLYTAGWSNYDPSASLVHAPVGYLTYVVWTFIQEPFASAHSLAYAAALILLLAAFAINLAARRWLGRGLDSLR